MVLLMKSAEEKRTKATSAPLSLIVLIWYKEDVQTT